jgi:DNA-binding CsgD family transcriptional regulator
VRRCRRKTRAARRDYAAVADAGGIAADVLRATDERLAASELPPTLGARREAELHLDTARAHEARRRGRPDPRAWARIAEAWISRSVPYFAAKARWWEALAALQARDQRTRARDALAEAWQLAAALPARPLLLELSGLARRARIQLPLVEGREADEVLAAVTAAQEAGVPLAPHRRSGDEADRAAVSASDESRVAATPTSVRGLVPVGPGIRHADAVRRVTGIGPGGTSDAADRRAAAGESAGLDEYDVGGIIALASTPTGRAIGERLVARESAEQRDPFGLSPRETEVLNVLVEGRTNREIAERLYISERTVGVHVRKILSKLGVAGRTEAASLAIRLGLAPEAHSEYLARRR